MEMFETALVLWLKSGIIAWALYVVGAVVYVLVRTKCDLRTIDSIGENTTIVPFKNQSVKSKIRVIARTIIWPWGVVEVFNTVIEDVEAAVAKKENQWRVK